MSTGADVKRVQTPTAPAGDGWVRRFLLGMLLFECFGTGVELLLVGHWEDAWQWAPLVLMLGGILAAAWCAAVPARAALRTMQALMGLFVLSGLAGTVLHVQAKMEFQLEVHPSLQGWALLWEAVKNQSPPTLAPAMMIQMGLLGLAYAYRHPGLRGPEKQR